MAVDEAWGHVAPLCMDHQGAGRRLEVRAQGSYDPLAHEEVGLLESALGTLGPEGGVADEQGGWLRLGQGRPAREARQLGGSGGLLLP